MNGVVVVPEVSHEITVDRLSDYAVSDSWSTMANGYMFKSNPMIQYEWTMETASSPPVDAVFALAKSRLPTALEVKFAEFASAIIDTHGKDLTVSTEPSRSGTPVGATTPSTTTSGPSASTSTPAPAKPVKKVEEKKSLSTTAVSVEANFMASGNDLFKILTDEKEIQRWAGKDAQVCLGYS